MIYQIKKFLYYNYRQLPHYYRDYKYYKSHQVRLYNWYTIDPEFWLIRFIKERGLLKANSDKILSIFSVFGYRFNIDIDRSDFKIFYTGENVHSSGFAFNEYDDLLLNKKSVNLSLGFDYIEHEQYLRFPLWLLYLFGPNESLESIRNICDGINKVRYTDNRDKFCAFLCGMDRFGFREKMYQQVNQIESIHCDGLFRHNNDDLKNIYADNKIEYLRNYKFNLCPENSNYDGYCTEKIFEAIKGGCIPIYWGTNNNPEPAILNHEAIFFIDPNDEKEQELERIKLLSKNEKLYKEFSEQDRLLPDAPEVIYKYFQDLETKLIDILG